MSPLVVTERVVHTPACACVRWSVSLDPTTTHLPHKLSKVLTMCGIEVRATTTEMRVGQVVRTLKERVQCNLSSVTPAPNTVVPQAKG
jgi:hypothetical protein